MKLEITGNHRYATGGGNTEEKHSNEQLILFIRYWIFLKLYKSIFSFCSHHIWVGFTQCSSGSANERQNVPKVRIPFPQVIDHEYCYSGLSR